ncbi:putative Rho GDP-dissociation inhibitor 1 [Tilletiaria anomala UBC 951]|uniref:Putative Rho GDP-dissociation inhibitor 1 n=1 Tax=Tilletiaria anomala (strain ATCC 24038 / CBS 436.72 / UBC 951) TaxID=1037660 RepID=A0A066WJM2_TILAU|nr:putative Rho GDP-dissociation inhibitor 1 [Tilletiaria anomala UBC 951]KDN52758.1 putative Rho GDP-dissociation inhibitor 1 [Tilletiaria anomala UBC 951]
MSQAINDDELRPTQTEGFKVGEKKTLDEYNQLDANDESLQRWKALLGIAPNAAAATGPKLVIHSLSMESSSAPGGKVSIKLDGSQDELEALKKNPLIVKEGVDYNIAISFSVGSDVLSGLKYLHVVKRTGVTVDKLEEMIGSYGPRPEPYTKRFITEEAPSGMLARSGTNVVRTRIIDDDGTVYTDFTWSFKLAKDWA